MKTRRRPGAIAPTRDLQPRHARRRRRLASAAGSARGVVRRPRLAATGLLGASTGSVVRLLLLLVEIAGLAIVIRQPAFASRAVEIDSARRVGRAEVLNAAGLGGHPSVFLVSTDRVEAYLLAIPYVRAVSVRTSLPDGVVIELTEWEPVAVVTSGGGSSYLLNEEGMVLAPATPADLTQTGAGGRARIRIRLDNQNVKLSPGQHVVASRLIADMSRMRDAFPSAYQLTVADFVLTPHRQLVAEVAGGPRILFGQMVTDEQISGLEAKLAALKALSSQVDLAHAKLDYVNLENPAAPVTHAQPPPPSPSPSPKH